MKRYRRKASSDTEAERLATQWEVFKAKVRGKIENPLHVVKNRFQHCKICFQVLAKNEVRLLMLFSLASWCWRSERCGISALKLRVEGVEGR